MKKTILASLMFITCFNLFNEVNAQEKEINKLLDKAQQLEAKNEFFAANEIYSQLILKQPNNALLYERRGITNYRLEKKELGILDYKTAISLIENKKCNCDFTNYYNNDKKDKNRCTIKFLASLYWSLSNDYDKAKDYDSSILYATKAIGLFYNSNGQYINFPNSNSGASTGFEIGMFHSRRAEIYIESNRFKEALNDYIKKVELGNGTTDEMFDIYYIMGNYSKAAQFLKNNIFRNYNKITERLDHYSYNGPKYFFGYIAAYISQRKFDSASQIMLDYSKLGYNEETGNFNTVYLLGEHEIYKKGESKNVRERIDTSNLTYTFFNYYGYILEQISNKNFASALSHLDNLYNSIQPKLINPYTMSKRFLKGDAYLFESNFYSLKGYLLSKLNKKQEAKQAYQKAIEINPNCTEAVTELKALN